MDRLAEASLEGEASRSVSAAQTGGIPEVLIRTQTDKILASPHFTHARRMSRFLQFTVERVLEGRAEELKEYVIGVEVFERKGAYDPRADAIVRVEAMRLRDKLKKYYDTQGAQDPVRIAFPKGSYAPIFFQPEVNPTDPSVSGGAPVLPHRLATRSLLVFGGLAVVLLAVSVHWSLKSGRRGAEQSGPAHGNTSIAVLPFEDLSPKRDQEYLSVGLTEELINALTRVPGLRLVATSSASTHANVRPDVRKIGRDLNVNTVLEGSVRTADGRLRITVRLSDSLEGSTLWSQIYERSMTDVFAMQEEISQAIVAVLRRRIPIGSTERLIRPRTASVEAYNLYLRGRYYWNWRQEDALKKAIGYFEQALAIDPLYAAAYSGLADSYALLAHLGSVPPNRVLPQAKAAAVRAIEIDHNLSEAHSSLGYIRLFYDWDWVGAEESFSRAIEINPSYATGQLWYAVLLTMSNRLDEALIQVRRAKDLDPLSPTIYRVIADIHHRKGELEKAIENCRAALELDPQFSTAYVLLGRVHEEQGDYAAAIAAFRQAQALSGRRVQTDAMIGHAYARWGRVAEAQKVLQDLQAASRQTYVPPFHMALIYVGLSDADRALEWLERALNERSVWMVSLAVDPRFASLRRDPRFMALVDRVRAFNSGVTNAKTRAPQR